MAKKDTSLDDIATAISDLATHMDVRFDQVDQRFEAIETDLTGIRKEQREMRELLGQIDSRILGIESDIKEIYDRIVALEAKNSSITANEVRELKYEVNRMKQWAKLVGQKTGIALPKL